MNKKEYENTFGIKFAIKCEEDPEVIKWPHEIMNYQELFDKCINIFPEIEIIDLDTQIQDTKIYSRMKNCLYNHGIINIKQLLDMNKIDFYRIKNMGIKTAQDALILQRYLIIKLKGQS